MILSWFASRTVRHANTFRKHVQKLLHHQRDILAPQAVEAVQRGINDLRARLDEGADKPTLLKQMEDLEKVAQKWLKPYPHAAWRENIEVLLVALAVAMGIRTFCLQPFKIPTGSMQPTLFGVTSVNLLENPEEKIPSGLERIRQWFGGVSYVEVIAKEDGELLHVGKPWRLLIFQIRQTLQVGNRTYNLWFPPDYGGQTLEGRAGLRYRQFYRKGEPIVRLKVRAGDHLFVDRFTYNFRRPHRGEIIVFETKGIPEEQRNRARIPGDQFYIKRLVGLGGERIELGDDRHLVINGKRLDSSTPHFERIYSFDPASPPQDSRYSGHISSKHVRGQAGTSLYFDERPAGVKIPEGHYMVMGDNTVNSLDSRAWGTFPEDYVIGRSFFVYWPITQRFGWGYGNHKPRANPAPPEAASLPPKPVAG